jgi:hypothetical protein
MFVRFRDGPRRLRVSLVETLRVGGQVKNGHVASLGSVPHAAAPADRIAFWTKLHQQIAGLSNRIDGKTHGEILAAVHARIPMPAQDEHGATQLEHARTDTKMWHAIAKAQADMARSKRAMVEMLSRQIAEHDRQAAAAADKATIADDRLARAERGEHVPGIPSPMTCKEMLATLGVTERQARLYQQIAVELKDEATFQAFVAETVRLHRGSEDAHKRAALRKIQNITQNAAERGQ